MKILVTSYHCCIRVIKQVLALNAAGVETVLLYNRMANDLDFETIVSNLNKYDGKPDGYAGRLSSLVAEHAQRGLPFDLIHVHNEPDWLGHIAKQACPELPVVFDVHDSTSVRTGTVTPDEAKTFELCDGFIFVSETERKKALDNNGIPAKPTAVIYSFCNKDFVGLQDLPRMYNTVVYEGGLTVTKGKAEREYRDWTKFCATMTRLGYVPYFFPAHTTAEIAEAYGSAGGKCEHSVSYTTLLRQLSRHDWGLVGAPDIYSNFEGSMPNKLFEYIAAGIPVLVYNAKEAEAFVRQHGLGICLNVYESLEQFTREQYRRSEFFRDTVRHKRFDFTMEKQTDKILDLYSRTIQRHELSGGKAVAA